MVHIVGEAGLGKSRLVLEFCETLALPATQLLQANCLEMFSSTPLYTAAGPLWTRAGIRAEDSEAVRRDKIATFLSDRGIASAEAIDTLAGLLGGVLTGMQSAAQLPPTEVKRRQFALIITLIGRITRFHPTLLWIEDAHWLDASSVELLPQLIAELREMALLIVLTRRSFPAGPKLPEADEEIVLAPLSPEESFELARAVPGAQALPEHPLSEVVTSADGIPLFVEQLVISLVNQTSNPLRGNSRSTASAVPLTLAEMLSERLDRQPNGRRIVQAAACIGRAFTSSFLAALLREDENALLDPLGALVGAEILRRQDAVSGNEFEFRHTLLRRVAYDLILQADRRAYHTRIVDLLKAHQDLGPLLPELMAHHLTAAGAVEAAVDSWLAAGTRAAQRSAHVEALEDLGRGLGLLDQVRDDALRRELEIKLHAARIAPIIATLGSTSTELGACCRRGLELCLTGEPSPLVFPLLFGQFTFLIGRARVKEALNWAKLFLALAERSDHKAGRVIGHRLVGMAHLGFGDLHVAREAVERSLQLYEPERDAAGTHMFGQNAQVHGSAMLSLALFCLGEVDAAFRVGIEALRAADELRHPHSTAIALAYVGGWVFGLSGADDVLLREARRLI